MRREATEAMGAIVSQRWAVDWNGQAGYFLAGALVVVDLASFFCDFCLFVLAVLFGLLSPMVRISFVMERDWGRSYRSPAR